MTKFDNYSGLKLLARVHNNTGFTIRILGESRRLLLKYDTKIKFGAGDGLSTNYPWRIIDADRQAMIAVYTIDEVLAAFKGLEISSECIYNTLHHHISMAVGMLSAKLAYIKDLVGDDFMHDSMQKRDKLMSYIKSLVETNPPDLIDKISSAFEGGKITDQNTVLTLVKD